MPPPIPLTCAPRCLAWIWRCLAGAVIALSLQAQAHATSTLQIEQGSGDFLMLTSQATIGMSEELLVRWTQDQRNATGGLWQLFHVNGGGRVVASGDPGPAPAPGYFARFKLKASDFGAVSANPQQYRLVVTTSTAGHVQFGNASAPVGIRRVPEPASAVNLGLGGSRFPLIEIANMVENSGVAPGTDVPNLSFDITLQASNPGKQATDPVSVTLSEDNKLAEFKGSAYLLPALAAGASTRFTLHLDGVLPSSTDSGAQRLADFQSRLKSLCGLALRSVQFWRGSGPAPLQDRLSSPLAEIGFGEYAKVSAAQPICSGSKCVSACKLAKAINTNLGPEVVGYSFFVGQAPRFEAHGEARTDADGGTLPFQPSTKMTVASVSKFVTALTTLRLLELRAPDLQTGLDTPIGPYLPSDWAALPGQTQKQAFIRAITLRQLLSQTSGIVDYGNVAQTDANIRSFMTQAIPPNNASCTGSAMVKPAYPINTQTKVPCYSNYNFGLLRLVLPRLAGFAEDPNPATRPATLARQFVWLTQRLVFDPVGRFNVDCAPPATNDHAWGHSAKLSNHAGLDWGDNRLVCGPAGWYLSAQDIGKVLMSLNAGDGRVIQPITFTLMADNAYGLDRNSMFEIEKNGGWSNTCQGNDSACTATVTATVAVFGARGQQPRVLAVLLLNSDIEGGSFQGKGAWEVLQQSYRDAGGATEPP